MLFVENIIIGVTVLKYLRLHYYIEILLIKTY